MPNLIYENRCKNFTYIPLFKLLKKSTVKHKSVSEKNFTEVLSAFDQLIENQDEITLLILENCALNIITHSQTILIEHPSVQIEEKIRRLSFHLGRFSKDTNEIALITEPYMGMFTEYSQVAIHEFTHSVCGLTFALDPRTSRARANLEAFPHDRSTFFADACVNFYAIHSLPYPLKLNPLDQENKRLPVAKKYPKSIGINPASLKFQQCIREDLKNQNNHWIDGSPMSTAINRFFQSLRIKFNNNNFSAEDGLAEVLSQYMELRTELIDLARKNGLGNQFALDLLAKYFPRIHDYCETDFKKVLGARLRLFSNELSQRGFESIYLSKNPPANRKVMTVYRETGRLSLVKNRFAYIEEELKKQHGLERRQESEPLIIKKARDENGKDDSKNPNNVETSTPPKNLL